MRGTSVVQTRSLLPLLPVSDRRPILGKFKIGAVLAVVATSTGLASGQRGAFCRVFHVSICRAVTALAADVRQARRAPSGNETTGPAEAGSVTLLTVGIDVRPLVGECLPGASVSRYVPRCRLSRMAVATGRGADCWDIESVGQAGATQAAFGRGEIVFGQSCAKAGHVFALNRVIGHLGRHFHDLSPPTSDVRIVRLERHDKFSLVGGRSHEHRTKLQWSNALTGGTAEHDVCLG